MPTMKQLQKRWLAKTGDQMPLWVEKLPMEWMERAVKMTEMNMTVFIPVNREPVHAVKDDIPDWDKHQEF
jgi:hypothetical protein